MVDGGCDGSNRLCELQWHDGSDITAHALWAFPQLFQHKRWVRNFTEITGPLSSNPAVWWTRELVASPSSVRRCQKIKGLFLPLTDVKGERLVCSNSVLESHRIDTPCRLIGSRDRWADGPSQKPAAGSRAGTKVICGGCIETI